MDESWRTSIGSKLPRRRSAEQTRRLRPALNPEDFLDVFGGPPRTVILRQFSDDLPPYPEPRTSTYDELFGSPQVAELSRGLSQGIARRLPGFRIPTTRGGGRLLRTEEGFYDDIFGADSSGERRSRTRSKCSSVLSSDDLRSPLRGMDDGGLSGFASKLRPITIPSRCHYSPPSTISSDDHNSLSTLSINVYPKSSYFLDAKDGKTNRSSDLYRQRSHMGFSCCFSPPETISLEASFRGNYMKSLTGDNSDADSPSSVISPLGFYTTKFDSYDTVRDEEAAAVDEAIAWAKQKFWSHRALETVDVKDDEACSSDSRSTIRLKFIQADEHEEMNSHESVLLN